MLQPLAETDLVAILHEFVTDFGPPQKASNGGTGLYCGEEDMFCFLIDPLGWVEINGIAWTGSGRIQRVDVSTDGGATWTPAGLQEPVLPKAHTRFRHLWNWTGGDAVILSRAADETGYVQPTRDALIASRGISSVGYHINPITGWRVRQDGTVVYHAEQWS